MMEIDTAIDYLLAVNNLKEVPIENKHDKLRALMNITMPINLSEKYYLAQDKVLQKNLESKKIIDADKIEFSFNIAIYLGDITLIKADAIVNACNEKLLGCFYPLHSCVDNTIHSAAGLSSAAGFEYGGKPFLDNFKYMHDLYGYNDMYNAGFHSFNTLEEKWAYWSKMIYLNRYKEKSTPLYERLYKLVSNKNYFVITTNVDHQFQKAGFNKERLFYMQGDYGLFQCSLPCHNKTYDNEQIIKQMIKSTKNNKIPTSLIPKCPKCGRVMTTNLRCDNSFVQDEDWYAVENRYNNFINKFGREKILFLELGVGNSTPVWIKYPFMKMTYLNKNATYVCVDKRLAAVPKEIKGQTILIKENIEDII